MKYVPPRGSLDPNADYIGGDPSSGIRGSYVPPGAVENPMREVCNAITLSGLTEDAGDMTQLWQAIQRACNAGLAGVTASEGNKAATNGAAPHITRDVSWDIPNSLSGNDALHNADMFGYYNTVDAHHRRTTWGNIVSLLASTVVNPIDIQIAGLGTAVGQQIIQNVDFPNQSTPGSYGWAPGQTTSAATLAAGTYQVGGYPMPIACPINSAAVPSMAGLGVANGIWSYWPNLAGTWQITGWTLLPGFAYGFGYCFGIVWKRIA